MLNSSGSLLAEKLSLCSICHQVFTDPVTTPCGHNFCQACIGGLWDDGGHDGEVCRCPTCSRCFSPRPETSVNLAFKELADSIRNMVVPGSPGGLAARQDQAAVPPAAQQDEAACDVCSAASMRVKAVKSCLVCLTSYCGVHLEPHRTVASLRLHRLAEPLLDLQDRVCTRHLRLLDRFCCQDQEPVCQFCTETEHRDHTAVTLEDESRTRKVQMKETEADFQLMIQQRLNKVETIRECVKRSATSTEEETKASERLFTALIRSAEERRSEVRAEMEEQQKEAERRAEQLMEELQQEVEELRRRSTELQELSTSEDHLHLLQRAPSLTLAPPTRAWSEVDVHAEVCVGTLRTALSKLDAALKMELDELKKQEMKRVQKYAVDVVLDPDTAHPNIVLSADGKQAGRGELLHVVPDNPQRFDPVICVISKKGFLSGRFYFQVSVGTKTFWDLGVVNEGVNRKGMITSTPENGYWTVRLRGGDEYRALDSPSFLLSLRDKPRTVGVFADYEAAAVSFFDVDSRSHIYTFSRCAFSGRIFPFFSPGVCDDGKNTAPLVITAVNQKT